MCLKLQSINTFLIFHWQFLADTKIANVRRVCFYSASALLLFISFCINACIVAVLCFVYWFWYKLSLSIVIWIKLYSVWLKKLLAIEFCCDWFNDCIAIQCINKKFYLDLDGTFVDSTNQLNWKERKEHSSKLPQDWKKQNR